jgi:hypothetical protein
LPVAFVTGVVDDAAGGVARQQIGRRAQHAQHMAVPAELVERRPVFVGHQQVPGQRVHDHLLGIERQAEPPGHRGRETVEARAAPAKDQRLEHLKIRDRAARAT